MHYRVRSTAQNGLYSWAVQKNIPALLIERGGLGLWSETEVNACCEDVRALLRHLDILPGGNPFRDQVEIAEARYVESAADGLWHPAAGLNDSVKAGARWGGWRTCPAGVSRRCGRSLTGLSSTTPLAWAWRPEIR